MPRKEIKPTDYFPLNADDIKHSIEVPVKQISREQIETIEPGIKKERPEKKVKATKTEKASKTASRYILIITEKPAAALKIASSLGDARKYNEQGVPYYELERDGKKIVVAAAVGHLFSITQKERQSGYPVFNIEWQPNYKVRKADFTKKYYSLLSALCKNAESFIVASDYDIEGEIIGLNIIRFICKQEDANRMKFSSLTKDELEQAYKNASKTLNWGQAIAGETRHYLDWMYGINLSRALMTAIKKAGSFRIMSIGRVQGPALKIIVEKEIQIQKFKPTQYWQIFILIDSTELKYIKDITKKEELEQFKNLKGKEVSVSTEKSEQRISPPSPFDLTTLQTEAYKFYGITPSRTLQIAQNLYLAGLISYPRTSSQKIPEAINPRAIIKKLKEYKIELCTRSKPVEGSKSDPAHPSIYPTGEQGELKDEERKIYDLIARRFLSCFCEDAIVENKTIAAIYENLKFTLKGLSIKEKGWTQMYKSWLQEKSLKDLNGKFKIKEVKIEEKMTSPPGRYSPASLVRELEKKNLGTKATRANIVETLYNRGYIIDKSIKATSLGISLIETLDKYSPVIIDEKLTRHFEKEMEAIQTAKKNLQEKEAQVIDEAKKAIITISDNFKKSEEKIGKELVKANNNLREQQAKDSIIGKCPVCKEGQLRIIRMRNGSNFVGCTNYPKCKNTYNLPKNALIKPLGELCKKCNFIQVQVIRKGKRPWTLCLNPECPGKSEYWKKK